MIFLSAAFACPSFSTEVDTAAVALARDDIAGVNAALAVARSAVSCAPVMPQDLARYWLVEGGRLLAAGDAVRAELAFAAARRIAPEVWDPVLGHDLRAAWEGAVPPTSTGTLDLDANHAVARVDGTPGAWPMQVATGTHLVQVGVPEVVYGKFVRVGEGDEVFIETGLPVLAGPVVTMTPTLPTEAVVEPEGYWARRRWVLAVGAGVAAAGGGALAYGAQTQEEALENAEDADALDAAWDRQRGFTYAAAGLWSASALGIGAFFLF